MYHAWARISVPCFSPLEKVVLVAVLHTAVNKMYIAAILYLNTADWKWTTD